MDLILHLFNRKSIKVLFLFFFFTNSYSQYIFENDSLQPEKISLHKFTEIIHVKDKDLNIQEVISKFDSLKPIKLTSGNDFFGYSGDDFWALVKLNNKTNQSLNYVLLTARPLTDLVELYEYDSNSKAITKIVNNASLNHSLRTFDSNENLFNLKIKPGDNLRLYLHVKTASKTAVIPIVLYDLKGLYKEMSRKKFIEGFFYGFLIITTIFFSFLYFAIRQISILYFTLFVFFSGLMEFALDGYLNKYLIPEPGWFSKYSFIIVFLITAFLFAKFCEAYLHIKKFNKKSFVLLQIVYLLFFGSISFVYLITADSGLLYMLANIIWNILFGIFMFSIIYIFYRKREIDYFFILGIGSVFFGHFIYMLENQGIIPRTFYTEISYKTGIFFEVVFLSLAITSFLIRLRNEKNQLTQKAFVKSQEISDLKSYFLSNISHELRTPLNIIINLNDFIYRSSENEKVKKKCKKIKYASDSLLNSVDDILDFSMIEKNEFILKNEIFSLNEMLKSVKKQSKVLCDYKGINFKYNELNAVPNLIICDKSRIMQVLNNLISNAIKYTSEGGFVKFEVNALNHEDEKTNLIFTISDSGIGIPKEKLGTIFDSFSQANIDNKRKFGGLGLGLYIVKIVINKLNGTIKINSMPGIGTTIEVHFDVVEQQKVENIMSEHDVYDLRGKIILVVEDNSMNQMVIKMITKKWLNTSVVFASNGQEALDAFKTNKFDIVLMDLHMPIMDGFETTIAIRNGEVGQDNASIPIIALTADVMESTKLRVTEIGMNHYLSKPIDKVILFEAIKNLV